MRLWEKVIDKCNGNVPVKMVSKTVIYKAYCGPLWFKWHLISFKCYSLLTI